MRERHSAANFAVLLHLALNLVRQDKTVKLGVKRKLKLAGWGKNYPLALLANAQDAISPGRLEGLIPALPP